MVNPLSNTKTSLSLRFCLKQPTSFMTVLANVVPAIKILMPVSESISLYSQSLLCLMKVRPRHTSKLEQSRLVFSRFDV